MNASKRVFTIHVPFREEDAETVLAALCDFDHAGMVEHDDGYEVHFLDAAEADRCHAAFPASERGEIEQRNWAEEWQAQWEPMLVGDRWFLAPEWRDDPTPEGRLRLEMRPGLVFGGGDHPTTRLCLRLLEEAVRPGAMFVDIGSGSAILAVAARLLGARVAACDIDPDAADESRRVLGATVVWEGSADALGSASADVIAANLPTGLLLTLWPEFERVAKPGASVILSGYLDEQREMLDRATPGWRVDRELAEDEWRARRLIRTE